VKAKREEPPGPIVKGWSIRTVTNGKTERGQGSEEEKKRVKSIQK